MEPPGGHMACPMREVGSWFVGSGEAYAPETPVGNPAENKPLQDPGVQLPRAQAARALFAGRSLIFCAVRRFRAGLLLPGRSKTATEEQSANIVVERPGGENRLSLT